MFLYFSYDYDVNNFPLGWILSVASTPNPAQVYSMSYGAPESQYTGSNAQFVDVFNIQAMKLALMGVTIVVASGDDGAPGFLARGSTSKCAYDPNFPASSPYVVAVGATQGLESGKTEVACSASTGGVVTSGGGFSILSKAPAFQKNAINTYFNTVQTKPVSGYNRAGRGFPDVSITGVAYNTMVGGKLLLLYGTSGSAPVFAAMVTLVNSARLDKGLPTIGWLNPVLYASNGSFANDITSGNNLCTVSGCCTQGYYSATGWDPVTGFGSVDFRKFYNLLTKNVTSSPTNTPTSFPTGQPSKTPTSNPTNIPTSLPSVQPSQAPTSSPTIVPTSLPSVQPSQAPTSSPTIAPTSLPSVQPSQAPTSSPTIVPTSPPTIVPTSIPSVQPSQAPTIFPTQLPASSANKQYLFSMNIIYILLFVVPIIGQSLS